MTLRAFYWLVLTRAWDHSFDRARKLSFFVTLVVGLLVWLSTSGWVKTVVSLAWLVIAGFFAVTFLWQVVRAPHLLYIEIAAKMPTTNRAKIRERLGALLQDGLRVIQNARNVGISRSAEPITAWLWEVNSRLGAEIGPEYIPQFRLATRLDPGHIDFVNEYPVLIGLQKGCDYLSKLIDRYSSDT